MIIENTSAVPTVTPLRNLIYWPCEYVGTDSPSDVVESSEVTRDSLREQYLKMKYLGDYPRQHPVPAGLHERLNCLE